MDSWRNSDHFPFFYFQNPMSGSKVSLITPFHSRIIIIIIGSAALWVMLHATLTNFIAHDNATSTRIRTPAPVHQEDPRGNIYSQRGPTKQWTETLEYILLTTYVTHWLSIHHIVGTRLPVLAGDTVSLASTCDQDGIPCYRKLRNVSFILWICLSNIKMIKMTKTASFSPCDKMSSRKQ